MDTFDTFHIGHVSVSEAEWHAFDKFQEEHRDVRISFPDDGSIQLTVERGVFRLSEDGTITQVPG